MIGELRPPQPPCPGTLAEPGYLYVCNIPCGCVEDRSDVA